MILKLLITRGNITLISKEATEEKEKENTMIEKKENKKKENNENIKNEITNATTTRGELQKNIHEFPFVSCSSCASNNSSY